jgi:hypothetical protein
VITAKAANYRIAEFVGWVNNHALDRGLAGEAIPADPDGPVTISRFRRTIAWHIARLPGGRIALAIQYGHLHTMISEGYSGRARHGLARVLDIETARAMVDYLHQLGDRISGGEGVSGPASPRLLHATRAAATRFEGMSLSRARPAPCSPTRRCRSTTTHAPSWPATTTRPRLCATPAGRPRRQQGTRAWTGVTQPAPTSPAPTPTSPP